MRENKDYVDEISHCNRGRKNHGEIMKDMLKSYSYS